MPDRSARTFRSHPRATAKSMSARTAVAPAVQPAVMLLLRGVMSIKGAPAYVKRMTTVADVSPRFKARAAGVCYLVMIALGGIQALAGRLPSSSDAAITAANILSRQSTV